MAWSTSDRRGRLPADWPKIRLIVGNRDGWRCQWRYANGTICGKFANQVDHKKRGDSVDPRDLQMLCEEHHNHKSATEGGEASAAALAARKRRVERPVEQPPVNKPAAPPQFKGFVM